MRPGAAEVVGGRALVSLSSSSGAGATWGSSLGERCVTGWDRGRDVESGNRGPHLGSPPWEAPLLSAPRPSRDSRSDLHPRSESSMHWLIGAMVPPSGRYWSGPRWRRGGPQPRGGANDRLGWRFSTITGRTAPPAPWALETRLPTPSEGTERKTLKETRAHPART